VYLADTVLSKAAVPQQLGSTARHHGVEAYAERLLSLSQ
jgi:hypothetical protein